MTRVVIASGAHQVTLDCEGTGNTVVKLAVQLWRETVCDCASDEDGQRSNWMVYTPDADTGEPG